MLFISIAAARNSDNSCVSCRMQKNRDMWCFSPFGLRWGSKLLVGCVWWDVYGEYEKGLWAHFSTFWWKERSRNPAFYRFGIKFNSNLCSGLLTRTHTQALSGLVLVQTPIWSRSSAQGTNHKYCASARGGGSASINWGPFALANVCHGLVSQAWDRLQHTLLPFIKAAKVSVSAYTRKPSSDISWFYHRDTFKWPCKLNYEL